MSAKAIEELTEEIKKLRKEVKELREAGGWIRITYFSQPIPVYVPQYPNYIPWQPWSGGTMSGCSTVAATALPNSA